MNIKNIEVYNLRKSVQPTIIPYQRFYCKRHKTKGTDLYTDKEHILKLASTPENKHTAIIGAEGRECIKCREFKEYDQYWLCQGKPQSVCIVCHKKMKRDLYLKKCLAISL